MLIVVVVIAVIFILVIEQVKGTSCGQYDMHPKAFEILENNTYGLWPGLTNKYDLETGETLVGFKEAMADIWKNQHPADCSKSKYLIVEGFNQGFGSEFHVYGVGLAMALEMNRVLLQKGGWTWRFKNRFCEQQQKKTLECFYHPWSNCTIVDAINSVHNEDTITFDPHRKWTPEEDSKLEEAVVRLGNVGFWTEIAKSVPKTSAADCYARWHHHLRKALGPKGERNNKALNRAIHIFDRNIADIHEDHRVLSVVRILDAKVDGKNALSLVYNTRDTYTENIFSLGEEILLKLQKYVPTRYQQMLSCAGMEEGFHFLWWRAISATYFIRPNHATLEFLERIRDPLLKTIDGQCISTYIRHGDKGVEMELVPTQKYLSTAITVWDQKNVPGMNLSLPKVFYVSSEDYEVFGAARAWGASNNVIIRYSNMSQEILSDHRKSVKQHDMERSVGKAREFEYLSYILHLLDTVTCEVAICTLPSNYCRLIDELRTTVGGKANRYFVDLSVETCPSRRCIRSHGLGNYYGTVHDPKSRLWRQ